MTARDFTPTDDIVRGRYVQFGSVPDYLRDTQEKVEGEAFDRWLKAHDQSIIAAAKAEAVRECERLVHAEARWQWERDYRRIPGAQIVAQRMQVIEKCLSDMAERIEGKTSEVSA